MNETIEVVVDGLTQPFGVGFDRSGTMYIVEMEGGERVVKRDRRGTLTTVVGTGKAGFSGDGGPATQAQINGAHHLLALPDGELLIADTINRRVRRVDPRTKIITTIAGETEPLGAIYCIALSPRGETLYLCDLDNRRIRALDRKSGRLTIVAGGGARGVPDDGQDALLAPLVDPRAVAVDSKGRLYILERGGDALRAVGAEGKIRTLLGKPNVEPAVGPMKGPKHLCIDGRDRVVIADTENNRILRFDPRSGRTERLAAGAELHRPHGVLVRRDDSLYIADSDSGRVLRVTS